MEISCFAINDCASLSSHTWEQVQLQQDSTNIIPPNPQVATHVHPQQPMSGLISQPCSWCQAGIQLGRPGGPLALRPVHSKADRHACSPWLGFLSLYSLLPCLEPCLTMPVFAASLNLMRAQGLSWHSLLPSLSSSVQVGLLLGRQAVGGRKDPTSMLDFTAEQVLESWAGKEERT